MALHTCKPQVGLGLKLCMFTTNSQKFMFFFCMNIFLFLTHPQIPWKTKMWILKWKQWKKKELGYIPSFVTLEGKKRCVVTMGCGLERITSESIFHIDGHKSNNKLINASLKHFWCMDKPWAYMDSQGLPWLKLEEAMTFPLVYIILSDSP
jgi:hypothetical protein